MTVGAESHLRDGHLVWTVSIKCPGTREDTRPVRAVSPPPRVWMSRVASPGVDLGHRMPHHRAGWTAGPATALPPPPPPTRAGLEARALTVLDDRDVDWRGAGHRQVLLLRGHGRGTLATPAHSRPASEPAPQQTSPLAHAVPAVLTLSNQWRVLPHAPLPSQ